MKNGPKKTQWERFQAFLKMMVWWWKGQNLDKQLADVQGELRSEAHAAVVKVVYETNIAPDCISALVFRGGCAIKVKHDDAWEMCIHNTYDQAADGAIEWLLLQGGEIKTSEVSGMSRKERRRFDAQRRKHRGGRKAGGTRH